MRDRIGYANFISHLETTDAEKTKRDTASDAYVYVLEKGLYMYDSYMSVTKEELQTFTRRHILCPSFIREFLESLLSSAVSLGKRFLQVHDKECYRTVTKEIQRKVKKWNITNL